MVAVHDAVSDLQQGKADLAIAGGVQAILNGRIYELRAEAMMLSPEGQCKTFDASADGYVRGEGCGVVVLKRLSQAQADGDRIWAVIRGSAVNNGGTSVGLTVPHVPALIQVMETALSDAGVKASDVDYLEAHGTGTAVGDPIELDAVADVYGRDRGEDRPILTGSVKTNIGHLESAAGIAGLIKAAMVLKHGVIPKHLHFNNPNPGFDWDNQPIRVTSEMMEWTRRDGQPRLAGVNSFGITGTNSHIVVEEYLSQDGAPEEERSNGYGPAVPVALPATQADLQSPTGSFSERRTRFLPLSGKSEGAVRDLANRYLSWLDQLAAEIDPENPDRESMLADMAWTGGVGRSHFEHRAGVVFDDVDSLKQRLQELAESGPAVEPRDANKIAFVYTGQGSQWTGMGHALYESEPVVRSVFDRCEAVFRDVRGTSLLDLMFGRPGAQGDLGDTAWEQPALYALECALTELWASVGVRPNVVLGHSVGELAAARTAGVFSLEDGMRLAATRGTLLSGTAQGTMAAIFAPVELVAVEVAAISAASDGVGLSIAADNGAHIVVSGPVKDIEEIVERFESREVRARRLNTTRAFHSALLDPVLDDLESFVAGLDIGAPSLTVISNVTGRAVEPGMALDAGYWKRHAREPVAFASGIGAAAELGVDLVVEIGPHAVLGPMATLAWPESDPGDSAPLALASLRRPPRDGSSPEAETSFVDAVAEAYAAGLDISFEGLFAGETRRKISLPSYPFQREHYWLEQSRQRRPTTGHPLLGIRHESARGEITFETEVFPSDPAWLADHKVFGRLIAPGALYGALAASVSLTEGSGPIVVDEMQLHSALVFSDKNSEEEEEEEGRKVQVVVDESEQGSSSNVQIYSRGAENEWTMHVECRVLSSVQPEGAGERIDLDGLKARLSSADVPGYYRAKSDTGIDLGPSFRTLGTAWSGPGEALAEVRLPEALGRNQLDIHPLLLDGCFQVVGVARNMTGAEGEATYLPFGWERFWLTRRLPDQLFCHVLMSEESREAESESSVAPEVLSGELRIYDPSGVLIGELKGYAVKRATRAALLSAVEGVDDLLYEVTWRERALPPGIEAADFFPTPAEVAAGTQLFTGYLADAGVDPDGRNALLADLERWSWARALATLEELGWRRVKGDSVDAEDLRQELDVLPEHRRVFRRMLEMLARAGVVEEKSDAFEVLLGSDDPLPDVLPSDLEEYADWMFERYPDGLIEIGLFRRSGIALGDVLRGQEDALTLLFSSGEPTAGDLYLKAPVARAANRLLADAVKKLVADMPADRRLRIIEVGAGTGSATASVLPELPDGRFDYVYTDISAGFFAEAEARFGDGGGSIEYRPLDIEKDPIEQGYDAHGFDLIIASNVLHATRYLNETLAHCAALLAPSGHLVALENQRGLGWMDLTFGQLDGWWRFEDSYRPDHALVGPVVWKQALGDSGFEAAEVLGVDDTFTHEMLDKGVIVAQGPARVSEPAGLWVLAGDNSGFADELAEALAARNQTVVLASAEAPQNDISGAVGPGVLKAGLDMASREAWRSLIEILPSHVPFSGVVHLPGLEGHGSESTTPEMAADVARAGRSALAMVQGVLESDAVPDKGVWFITSGGQILEREQRGELAGSVLWGVGKVVNLEAAHLQPRMIDLDPAADGPYSDLLNELLYPDEENHIAYRQGRRRTARLVRPAAAGERLDFPEGSDWVLAPDRDGVFEKPEVKLLPPRNLEPREVLVSVEATGLNFWDVFRSLGFIEEGDLGRELCGHVLQTGSEVSGVSVGDRVVGLGFGAFGPEMVTREELVAPAPDGISVSALATIPSAFVSAALSYQLSGLEAGDRVLIHAGSGGVGLAAIQIAQAAGAEVFATASAPKQAFLRSLGVKHIFDSRQTRFGEEILEATGGEGVDVVLNSLTSEGFIDASLDCLAQGGRFIELARRDILSEAEMAALRPDVKYDILELDVLKKTDPAWVGEVLTEVMGRISAGELEPLIHSRWPLAEAGAALGFMRSARHIGKIVLTPPPLMRGQLRQDRAYLVTGGLGGIGLAVAEWLAGHGAGVIVLNGRRDPDPEAEEAIEALRNRGVRIEVELADVTDSDAVDAMMARIDDNLPPLGGVVHSVGVLSDAALTNQTWESFEQVLWPKILGAWHLHRATVDLDLDMFILFSSRVGVMGNPGQANHAAANAFLDQLAGHRRALGLPGQAIAWGAWSEIGEAAEQKERIERRRAALGGRWFTPEQGIKALDRLVREDTTTSVVMAMDWPVFAEAVQDRPPLLEDMLSSTEDDAADDSGSSEDVLSRLRSAAAPEHDAVLVPFLQEEVQAVLRLPAAPSPTVGFFDLGMDSLMAVEVRNRLNRAFSGEYVVSNTAVFDYPDINSLAGHLAGELGEVVGSEKVDVPVEQPAPAPRQVVQTGEDGIAIVGMACRMPGSPDLEAFWRVLEEGRETVTDGRQDAGDWDGVTGDPSADDPNIRRGGFVEGLDRFDARFFRIAPIEARSMDPQQRMLLETSWQALEDAGIAPDSLKGSRSGVFVGIGSSEYRDLIAASDQQENYFGTTGSVAAGRIAFALGLEGPAMPVDMACASSIAAVHHAVAALERGEVDLALVGGVNANLSQAITRFHHDLGMLSTAGRCNAFDANADGFVRGEGCGVLVLKRLSQAEADSDRIWGLVKGSAVNQNGASAGLPVPNGPAQEVVISDALARAGVAPSEVDYLEAHGTGTELGDSIELRAVSAVYGQDRDAEKPLLIGSVKTNIGHLEWASGMASIIKAVLAMNRGVIPAHLHFQQPNPELDWDQMPVKVTSEPTSWPAVPGRPPLAAVNAFGLSGTNAHVVLEGYEGPANGNGRAAAWPAGPTQLVNGTTTTPPVDLPPVQEDSDLKTRLLPLSGKSAGALRDLAGAYLRWLDENVGAEGDAGPDTGTILSDMSWTTGIGRSHFDHRKAVVFNDVDQLRAGLDAVAGSEDLPERPDSPLANKKVAFLYAGQGGQWPGMGGALYQSEPVVRAVMDRCDRQFQDEYGESLLEVVFGGSQGNGDLSDPVWAQPAIYALECALTALWRSVGVSPSVLLGSNVGEIAAAQAAGMLSLEDGLRLTVRLNGPETELPALMTSEPSATMISSLTGRVAQPSDIGDKDHWRRLLQDGQESSNGLDGMEVGLAVELGILARPGSLVAARWPAGPGRPTAPAVLDGLVHQAPDGSQGGNEEFVRSIARAYEGDVSVSFSGLFAGEQRRRVSVPLYPFQRRRFWVQSHNRSRRN